MQQICKHYHVSVGRTSLQIERALHINTLCATLRKNKPAVPHVVLFQVSRAKCASCQRRCLVPLLSSPPPFFVPTASPSSQTEPIPSLIDIASPTHFVSFVTTLYRYHFLHQRTVNAFASFQTQHLSVTRSINKHQPNTTATTFSHV